MASSLNSSFQTSNLRTVFLGKKNEVSVSSVPVNRVGFLRKTVVCKESRIGKQPIQVPSNVTITLEGELSQSYPREVNVEREEPGTLKVKKAMETRRANKCMGFSGFEKKLQLIGVGYRAMLEGNDLVLNLGFSHPVRMAIPDGIKVKVEDNTRITVSGYDKSAIGQFAASVRRWRPPEPYKGKGVKYADEIVRRKEGKAGKKK
ncbi:50s ribosomal protein l6 [Quercus suber]|uniref:50s ribosomal protein l6 n=1 Tax=Quercus suber TaxID=58331 RepID=A0AAW0J8I7_QUESU